MNHVARVLGLASALLVTGAASIAAQKAASDAADMKDVAAYRLTMAGVHKYEVAMRAYAAEALKDPRYRKQITLKAQIDTLKKKEDLSDEEQTKLESLEEQLQEAERSTNDDMGKAETIADMVAQVDKVPGFAAALRSAGLAPREYAVMTLALFQAMAYAGLKKQGYLKELPKDANAANIAFVEQHEAELGAMQERMKQLGSDH